VKFRIGYIIMLLAVLQSNYCISNTIKIDSLKALIAKDKEDTLKVSHLNELSYLFRNSYPDSTILYANQSVALCNNIIQNTHAKLWFGYANALGHLGIGYRLKGDYPKAQEYYFKALEIDEKMGFKFGIGKRLVGISNMFLNIGNLPQALNYAYKAHEINSEIKNERAIALSNGIIANVFNELGNNKQALLYQNKSIKTFLEIKDYNNIQSTYTQLGKINNEIRNYSKAIYFLNKALKVANENGLVQEKGETLNELAAVYFNMKRNTESIKYSREAIHIHDQNNIKGGIGISYYFFGSNLMALDSLAEAEYYLLKALDVNTDNSAIAIQAKVCKKLQELYQKKKLFQKALAYHLQYTQLKDSIYSNKNSQKIMIIEFEKNKSKSELIQKANKLVALKEIDKQKFFRNTFIFGFTLMLIVAAFILRSYQLKQKDNEIINKQKLMVENQKQEITDSIQYAQRIQQAILPTKESIAIAFPQSFILFKPKDIVSGDFYWFQEVEGKKYIAACDCTGHGVPGALMSMVATDMLNEALVHTKKVDEILALTNRSIKTALKQNTDDDSTRDGMDLALCCFNDKTNVLQYAGAYRPLWLIRKGSPPSGESEGAVLLEYKGTKAAIGGLTEDNQEFKMNEIQLQKGDTIYLSSDGYADQFSPKDKKLMTKRFKEILLSIQHLTMPEQEKYLSKFIEDWKGNMEQTDDVLVIGVRV
jgi:serine phosphatase RsbU (regulator of sigma subunit)/tetratricopeptide (TPR) repeat protein